MLNKVVLIGRLTRDPELKHTQNAIACTTFTLAVDRNYTNQQGEREADFIPIVTWRGLAETCNKYLAKGRLTAVSGRLQTRSYDTPEGHKRYITEVVADEVQFLERTQENQKSSTQAPSNLPSGVFNPINGDDDELPF